MRVAIFFSTECIQHVALNEVKIPECKVQAELAAWPKFVSSAWFVLSYSVSMTSKSNMQGPFCRVSNGLSWDVEIPRSPVALKLWRRGWGHWSEVHSRWQGLSFLGDLRSRLRTTIQIMSFSCPGLPRRRCYILEKTMFLCLLTRRKNPMKKFTKKLEHNRYDIPLTSGRQ